MQFVFIFFYIYQYFIASFSARLRLTKSVHVKATYGPWNSAMVQHGGIFIAIFDIFTGHRNLSIYPKSTLMFG